MILLCNFVDISQDNEADSKIKAMQCIVDALAPLAPAMQTQVLEWAVCRFGASHKSLLAGHFQDKAEERVVAASDIGFNDFASLFDALNPKTGPEKALAAGYWFQICKSNETFESFQANSELKHLGHGLSNVTDALNSLIKRKPAFVLQVRKSGKSKQARKKYKLTREGIEHVRTALGSDEHDG